MRYTRPLHRHATQPRPCGRCNRTRPVPRPSAALPQQQLQPPTRRRRHSADTASQQQHTVMATPTAVRAWQAALNRASAAAASSAAAVNPSTGTKKWRKGRGASLVARGRPVGETREVGSAPGSCEALREGSPHACSIHLRPQRAGCALAPACRTPRHDRGPAAARHLLPLRPARLLPAHRPARA